MDWVSLFAPVVVTPVVTGFLVLVGIVVNRKTIIGVHKEKLGADEKLIERKFEFDKDLARERFKYERQQAMFQRRFELAEQVLADAYRFRDLMKFVRNDAAWEGEGESREIAGHETEGVKQMRTAYFVPLERLQKESEFISGMMARRETCHAHFGGDAVKAFDAFHQAAQGVRVAAKMLMDMAGDDGCDPGDRVLRETFRHDIWETLADHKEDNRIGIQIDEGVALIERICRPVLEWVDRP